MAIKVVKDPDNKWMVYIDWSNWLADIVSKIGGTATITASSWSIPAALTEEAETPSDDIDEKTFLVASGGTVDTEYDLVNTITYSLSTLSVTDLTEDRTVTVSLKEK